MTARSTPAATRSPPMFRVGVASFGLTILALLTLGSRAFA